MDVSPILARIVEHVPLTQILETSPVLAHQALLASVVSSLVSCLQSSPSTFYETFIV